jgi:hypothetical protein
MIVPVMLAGLFVAVVGLIAVVRERIEDSRHEQPEFPELQHRRWG